MEKYCRAGQATDDNTTQALYMLDTKVYKHTPRICNIYCFSTTLNGCDSVLRYTCITCLIVYTVGGRIVCDKLWTLYRLINHLKTKHRLLYLKTQFVPRSKHFSSQL